MSKLSKLNHNFLHARKKTPSETKITQSDDNSKIKEIFFLIDRMLPAIFPDEKDINDGIKLHRLEADKITNLKTSYIANKCIDENSYSKINFPFHLKKPNWIVNYLEDVIQKELPDYDIDKDLIKDYMQKSIKFKLAYEKSIQKFIKVKLKNMLVEPRLSHELLPEKGFPDFSHLLDSDKYFRLHAFSYFKVKGFDRHTIDVGLETNANIWRKKVMIKNFMNIYYPIKQIKEISATDSSWCHDLYKLKQKHLAYWLKYREYEYYVLNKAILNELGLVTKNMRLSIPQVEKIIQKLSMFENERNKMFANKINKVNYVLDNCYKVLRYQRPKEDLSK